MPGILLAVLEQDLVQLLDVVLAEGYVRPGVEDDIHDLRVAGHFLFVARIEALDLQVGQQLLDFAIGELAALDPCRGADAFDGGDPAQGR